LGGSWVPISNTMSPGPTSTSLSSGILIHPAVWPQQTWAEHWVGGCARGGSPSNNVQGPRPTPIPRGILIHAAIWPQHVGLNWRCCAPLLGATGVPILHNVAWAKVYLHTKWNLNPSSRLATTDMDRKLGVVPLSGRVAGSPSNTMWSLRRPTSMPSFILIHPTVWPQQTNATDRQEKQTDNGLIA